MLKPGDRSRIPGKIEPNIGLAKKATYLSFPWRVPPKQAQMFAEMLRRRQY